MESRPDTTPGFSRRPGSSTGSLERVSSIWQLLWLLLWICCLTSRVASATVLAASDSNWYDETGLHDPAITNFGTGRYVGTLHRSFVVFGIPSNAPTGSARLRVYKPLQILNGATVYLAGENGWYKAAYRVSTRQSYQPYPIGSGSSVSCGGPPGTAGSADCGGGVGLLAGGDDEECPLPQAPSGVAVLAGANIGERVRVFDSSTLLMSGGYVGSDLIAFDIAHLEVSGGEITESLPCSTR